jgi:hypothetical protein
LFVVRERPSVTAHHNSDTGRGGAPNRTAPQQQAAAACARSGATCSTDTNLARASGMSIQSKTHSLQAAIPRQPRSLWAVNQRGGDVRQPLTASLDRPIFSHLPPLPPAGSHRPFR